MRVYVCRREAASAREAAQRLAQCGHRIAAVATAQEIDLDAMRDSDADLYLIDRFMPHPDGEYCQRALHPRRCVLIGTDLQEALWEVEVLSQSAPPESVQRRLLEELLGLGFRVHTRGGGQLFAALCMVQQDERRLEDLKRLVYPAVAARYGCTWQSVERNLRYAIESAWTRGSLQALQSRFGSTIDAERGKPTNKAFLAQLTESIRLHRA